MASHPFFSGYLFRPTRRQGCAWPSAGQAGCVRRAAGQPGRGRGGRAQKKGAEPARGRSRGGFGIQIHILANHRGRPLHLRVTGGPRLGGSLDRRAPALPDRGSGL